MDPAVTKALGKAQLKAAARARIVERLKELGFDPKTVAKETMTRWIEELLAKDRPT